MLRNVNDPVVRISTTIAAAAAVSGSISLLGRGPRGVAVQVPSAWTAADLAMEVSEDGTTWVHVRDEIGAIVRIISIQTSEAGIYLFPASSWYTGAFPFMRLVSLNTTSGTTWTIVNQASERSLKVVLLG